jgi:dipeptidyl aminopeptidase/acylaminoacyl peptidase
MMGLSGDVLDAGKWLVSQGIANPNKLAVAGWSYGGYAEEMLRKSDSFLRKAMGL